MILAGVCLVVYFAGWLIGTRQRNSQGPLRNVTIDAGENDGEGIGR